MNVEVARRERKGKHNGRLRIGELARRADVPRATIQFYVRERLLPSPVKTGRTMAYYDLACVERVTLIKELQRRYLPLSVIRRMLAGGAGARAANVAQKRIRHALQPSERSMTRAEALAEFHTFEDTLIGLERLGLVTKTQARGAEELSPWDVGILRAVAKLQGAGVKEAAGFDVADLVLYRDAMRSLLEREVAVFGRSIAHRPTREIVRLAVASAVGATELIVAIRGKLIDDLVASAKPRKRRARAKKR